MLTIKYIMYYLVTLILTLLISGCVFQHKVIEGVEVQELGYTAAMLMDTGSSVSGLSVSDLNIKGNTVEFTTKRGVQASAKILEIKTITGFDGNSALVPIITLKLSKKQIPTKMFLIKADTIYEGILGRDYLKGTCVYVEKY